MTEEIRKGTRIALQFKDGETLFLKVFDKEIIKIDLRSKNKIEKIEKEVHHATWRDMLDWD